MPTPPLSTKVIRTTLRAVADVMNEGGYYVGEKGEVGEKSAIAEASRRSGIDRRTMDNHILAARKRFGWTYDDFTGPEPPSLQDAEDFGDGLALLQESAGRNAQYIEKAMPKTRVRIVQKEPFAIAFVGDIHADNKGCNVDQLLADLELFRAARIRCWNIGDTLDNFHKTGKLAKKQAQNRLTPKEGLAVARWIVEEGAPWDVHLLGNHDAWAEEEFESLMRTWAARTGAKVHNWIATVRYQWDDGAFTVTAAHDFKGHSSFNPLHANAKRALEDGTADLYVAGHRHTAAQAGWENGFRARRYDFLRVKGYKDADDYAVTKGFPQQKEGHSAIAVIDPWAETMEARCRTFLNLTDGVEYLEALRRRT